MINKIADIITDFFIFKNIIKGSEKDIYVYGLDLIISGLVSAISIIIIGCITGTLSEAVIYLIIMISIRMYTGGYHANTHLQCTLTFILCYIISLLVLVIETNNYIIWTIRILAYIGVLIINKYAPLDNANKRLDYIQKRKYRKIGLTLYLVFILIAIVIDMLDFIRKDISLYIYYVLIIIIALLIIGVRKEMKNNV